MRTNGSGPKGPDDTGGAQIFVIGINGKTYTMDIHYDDTIGDVKEKINDKLGIPTRLQILTYNGKTMWDEKSMKQIGIMSGSTLRITTRLRGGTTVAEVENAMNAMLERLNRQEAELIALKGTVHERTAENLTLFRLNASLREEVSDKPVKPPGSKFQGLRKII